MRDFIKVTRDKMTAAVLYGKRDVRIEQIPIPRVARGEVLVRIKAALTCGTDLKVYRQGFHARMIVPPSVFGHEMAGLVEETGEGVDSFRPGMRVVSANSGPCNRCFFCERHLANLCEDLQFLNGAYAEYIKIPERIVRQNLLILPDNLSFREAALVEPLACVLRAIEETAIAEGDTVVVIGMGPIGLMFVRMLKQLGATVIAVGKREKQLVMGERMGADYVLDATHLNVVEQVRRITNGRRGADVVIEAVGTGSRPWEWFGAAGRSTCSAGALREPIYLWIPPSFTTPRSPSRRAFIIPRVTSAKRWTSFIAEKLLANLSLPAKSGSPPSATFWSGCWTGTET